MNPVALAFGATWALILGTAAWYIARAIHRRYRASAQPRSDLAACQAIWPDPPSARVIEAQHRLDTAKQRKEEGQ